jgi:purine-binding chemotaxis protein CheW
MSSRTTDRSRVVANDPEPGTERNGEADGEGGWLAALMDEEQGGHRYLVARLGGLTLAVRADQARYVERPTRLAAIPLGSPWVEGVMTLRGEAILVVDTAGRFGIPQSAERAGRSRVVVLEAGGQTVGLVADQVLGVLFIADELIQFGDEAGGTHDPAFVGTAELGVGRVMILDVDRVLSDGEPETADRPYLEDASEDGEGLG